MSPSNGQFGQGTGSIEIAPHEVRCKFGRYEVAVKLGPDDTFLGISGVSVRKDFLSLEEQAECRGSHDVTDLYESE